MCYRPEFGGCLLDKWAYLTGVELDFFSRPGTRTEDEFTEAFRSVFRHAGRQLPAQERVDVYFLANQMGTSVKMIEGSLRPHHSMSIVERD